ncbi:M15 family metallopeptidase [Neobacillus sp. SM06]|uniref:M15 family metallopeptidase n=1 Tax=Neobacillus sp. SM06 TaxID=3422492 RepID=UPI003D28BACD
MKLKNLLIVIGSIVFAAGCSNLEASVFKPNQAKQQAETAEKTTQNDPGKTKNPGGEIPQKANTNASQDELALPAMYFNSIKQVDGKNQIQNPTNPLVLVNKDYALPDQYVPGDLVRPNVAFSFGDQKLEQSLMRKDAAQALENMFAEAKKAGVELFAVSGYRSFNRQKTLFDAEVKKVGQQKAEQAVAVPGTSEHQSGLAMDIAGRSTNFYLTEDFTNTVEGKWLAENAYRFGFILRYPKGKEAITHYEFEPWHFRYVGVKAATIIDKHQWTLEEYFQEVKKI